MADPITTIETSAITGLVGVIVGYWLKVARENFESTKARAQRVDALFAEIDYCARLARTYGIEGYKAPLYRFPKTVFEAVYPHLVSEVLSIEDVQALTGFYSQVDQMNRGLDAIERYRAANDQENLNKEVDRLIGKARQMQHSEAIRGLGEQLDFYSGAVAAVERHRKKR